MRMESRLVVSSNGYCSLAEGLTLYYTSTHYYTCIQERQGSDVLADSLLLREMAEELRREHGQHGAKGEEGRGSRLQQDLQEPNREHHSFQNVLK